MLVRCPETFGHMVYKKGIIQGSDNAVAAHYSIRQLSMLLDLLIHLRVTAYMFRVKSVEMMFNHQVKYKSSIIQTNICFFIHRGFFFRSFVKCFLSTLKQRSANTASERTTYIKMTNSTLLGTQDFCQNCTEYKMQDCLCLYCTLFFSIVKQSQK